MLDSSLRPVGQARKSIAVIGAGIAGLACARICVDKGYTVTVFDKGRGPGGRLSSRRLEAPQSSDPMVFDHGAQYLTIRDEGFDQLLKPLVQNK
ncbi:MAG: FAD-dependent oxidoreductase, partial [Rhodospirillaceae bacterium]